MNGLTVDCALEGEPASRRKPGKSHELLIGRLKRAQDLKRFTFEPSSDRSCAPIL